MASKLRVIIPLLALCCSSIVSARYLTPLNPVLSFPAPIFTTFTSNCSPIEIIISAPFTEVVSERLTIQKPCNKCCPELILPPQAVELPYGLGYLPAAEPVVTLRYCNSYDICNCNACSACVPVTSPCSCTALATPFCSARPILL